MDEVELTAPLLVLHQQVELELSVAEAVLEARSLKTRVRVGQQDMGLGIVQTEGLTLGLILQVDMLQFLVHHFGESLRLFLRHLLVRELVVEVVLGTLHIRNWKPYER